VLLVATRVADNNNKGGQGGKDVARWRRPRLGSQRRWRSWTEGGGAVVGRRAAGLETERIKRKRKRAHDIGLAPRH